MKEEKLLESLVNSDKNAFNSIVKKYSGYVYTVARNFSRGALPEEDIDEIAAEVFYKLWSIRGKLSIRIGLPAYLSAAVRNAVKNRFRNMKPPNNIDISELEIASDFFVEEKAELNEKMNCLYEGIETLPECDRIIFLRFYLYGEKTSQIAKAMKKSEGSVRTGLSRTRSKLRKYMTERGYDHV